MSRDQDRMDAESDRDMMDEMRQQRREEIMASPDAARPSVTGEAADLERALRTTEDQRDRLAEQLAEREPPYQSLWEAAEERIGELEQQVAALTAERDEARGALRLAAKAIVGYSDAAATPVPGASHE